tara:strand:- start:250 stop:450 length:201 start_codon:yes stop_codon:yes gene_type:complete
VPAQTALLEFFFTNVKQTAISAFGLICTIIGAIVYTYGDFTGAGLDFVGLVYAGKMLLCLVLLIKM